MVITYHTGECIKTTAGDTTLVFGPVSKQSKNLKPTNFGADIACISRRHPDMSGVEQVSRGGKEPFVVDGPGEYEAGSVSLVGFQTMSGYEKGEYINTVYHVLFDGISLLYAGALSDGNLPGQLLEDVDEIDVLFVPIGGGGVLDPAQAQKLAVLLEAKIVVPIHWDGVGAKGALETFLKEAGAEDVKTIEKLTIKPKDVSGKSGEVVALKA